MSSKILLRRGTAAQWSSANPILGIGELGIETDTLKIKIGNGTSTWTQLTSYANVTPSQLTSEINNLINAAPSTLDTLNELAAAINNDASFSTTVNNLLTGKVSKSGGDTITANTASTIGLIIKGAVSQTANLQEWQNSSGTTISWVNSTGSISLPRTSLIRFNGGVGVDRAYITSNTNNDLIFATAGGAEGFRLYGGSTPSGALITNSNANAAGFIIKGAASQASNLQEWQNSAGTVLSRIDNGGNLYAPFVWINGYQYAQAAITSSSAVLPALILKGASSQTADLQQWQNSSASVLAKVDSLGNITATDYRLSNSLYNIKKTLKKTIDPAQNAIAGNTYDLFQIAFSSSLQGIFTMQVSIRNGGYGQSMSYTLPVTYVMDWLAQYGITNPFTDSTTWVDLTPITFAPRHLMTNDYLKFQARVNANIIFFRIKLTGQLTNNPLFDVYIQHSEEFANSTVTELSSTGTDFTTSGVLPNFLSSKAGATAIFNPVTITSSLASTVPLKIKSATSQSANLQEWQNSDGTVLVSVSPLGFINTSSGIGTNTTSYMNGISDSAATKMSLSFNSTSYGLLLTNIQPAAVGYIVKGAALQTANLQEWQNSAGNISALIDKDGISQAQLIQAKNTLGVVASGESQIKVISPDGIKDIRVWNRNDAGGFYYFNSGGSSANVLRITHSTPTRMAIQLVADFTNSSSAAFGARVNIDTVSTGAVGLAIRGVASQTANLTEWQNSSGTVLANVNAFGDVTAAGVFSSGSIRGGTISGLGGFHSYTSNVPSVPVAINRAAASQTASIEEWQNSAGTVLSKILAGGQFIVTGDNLNNFQSIGASSTLYNGFSVTTNTSAASYVMGTAGASETTFGVANSFYIYDGIAGAMRFKIMPTGLVGINSFSPAAQLQVNSSSASTAALIVKGAASQTADLQQWQNSAGEVQVSIKPTASLTNVLKFTEQYSFAINWGNNPILSTSTGELVISPYGPERAALIVKGLASQTDNLQEWQNSSGTVLARITSTGTISGTNGLSATGGSITGINSQANSIGSAISGVNWAVTAGGATLIPIVAKGATSQTANLQEWQNSAGTVLAKVAADGQLSVGSGTSNYLSTYDAYGNITSRTAGTNYSANISVLTGATSYIGMVIRGQASQTANLQEWQNSAGTVVASMRGDGLFNSYWGYHTYIQPQSGTGSYMQLTNNGILIVGYSDVTNKVFTVKGMSGQTGNLQEWQNSAGTILGEVVYTGQYINRTQIYADNTQSGSAALVAKTNYGNVTPFVVQGAADAQTADLQKWITHGGTVLAKVDGNGSATFTGSASTNAISAYSGASGNYVFQGFNQSNNLTSIIYQSGEIYSASNIYIQGAANYSAAINVKPGSTSTSGIVVRGLTSQSADLQQWQNSSGAVLAEITASGSLELNGKDIELMNIMGAF